MNISSELIVVLLFRGVLRRYMRATLVGYGVAKAPPSEACCLPPQEGSRERRIDRGGFTRRWIDVSMEEQPPKEDPRETEDLSRGNRRFTGLETPTIDG
jgi:hypothetical protein